VAVSGQPAGKQGVVARSRDVEAVLHGRLVCAGSGFAYREIRQPRTQHGPAFRQAGIPKSAKGGVALKTWSFILPIPGKGVGLAAGPKSGVQPPPFKKRAVGVKGPRFLCQGTGIPKMILEDASLAEQAGHFF